MNEARHFILHQAARFGAISMKQLLQSFQSRRSVRSVYDDVKALVEDRCLSKVIHPIKSKVALIATPKGLSQIYSPKYHRARTPRLQDLEHLLGCTQILLELACYKNVSGLATEYELTLHEVKELTLGRTPDGVIQITRADATYELAVEYEAHQKDVPRIAKVLEAYELAFKVKTLCTGLILITGNEATWQQYQSVLKQKDQAFQKRVILKRFHEIATLNPTFFGERFSMGQNSFAKTLQKARTSCKGQVCYLPMISSEQSFL